MCEPNTKPWHVQAAAASTYLSPPRDRCSSASAKLARSRQAHSSAPRRRGSVLGNFSEISLYFTEVPAYFPSSKRHLLAAVGIFLRIFPESESEGDPLISLKLSGNSYMGQCAAPLNVDRERVFHTRSLEAVQLNNNYCTWGRGPCLPRVEVPPPLMSTWD